MEGTSYIWPVALERCLVQIEIYYMCKFTLNFEDLVQSKKKIKYLSSFCIDHVLKWQYWVDVLS